MYRDTVLAGGDSVKVYFFTSLQIRKEDFRYIAPVKSYKVTPVPVHVADQYCSCEAESCFPG